MPTTFAQNYLGAGLVHGPGWQPRLGTEARGGLLTAAERSKMVRRLIAIEALFLKADALRLPRGFEVQTRLVGGGLTTRTELARYGLPASLASNDEDLW